jgi:hypothetical protein
MPLTKWVNEVFPELQIDDESLSESEKIMGKVFLFDFAERKYVLRDGRPVEANYDEAIRQWFSMLMITELDKFQIYSGTDFGISLAQFVGRKDIPLATITSEVSRQIIEAATKHPEITGIERFSISRSDGKATLHFDVITKRGKIEDVESEVKYSG